MAMAMVVGARPADGGAATVVGSAHTVDKMAELRTWEHLAQLHAARFKGAELPLDRVRYAALVKKMQAFFAQHAMHVTLVDAAGGPPTRSTPLPASASATVWLAVVIMLAGAGALLYFLLRKA